MLIRLLLITLLFSCSIGAQDIALSRQGVFIVADVADLPGSDTSGRLYLVQDSLAGTCATGGGSIKLICAWDGVWSVYGATVAGSGSISQFGTYSDLQSEAGMVNGDRWMLTDSVYDEAIYDGADWNYFKDGILCTLPDDTSYAWENQDNSFKTADNGAYRIGMAGGGSASGEHSVRWIASPSPPWTITAGFTSSGWAQGMQFGLLAGDSGSDRKVFVSFGSKTSLKVPNLSVEKWNSTVSWNSYYSEGDSGLGFAKTIWIRMEHDGTDLNWSLSGDGHYFTEIISSLDDDFLNINGPDEVGIMLRSFNLTNAYHGFLFSWKVE